MSDNTCRKCYHIDMSKAESGFAPCKLCDSEQELDRYCACTDWTDRKPKIYLGKIKPSEAIQKKGCKGISHRFFAENDNEAKTIIHRIALQRYDQDYDTILYLAEVTEPDTSKGEIRDLHRVLIDRHEAQEDQAAQIADYLSTIRHLSGKLDSMRNENDNLAGRIEEQKEEIAALENERDDRTASLLTIRNEIDGLQLDT